MIDYNVNKFHDSASLRAELSKLNRTVLMAIVAHSINGDSKVNPSSGLSLCNWNSLNKPNGEAINNGRKWNRTFNTKSHRWESKRTKRRKAKPICINLFIFDELFICLRRAFPAESHILISFTSLVYQNMKLAALPFTSRRSICAATSFEIRLDFISKA